MSTWKARILAGSSALFGLMWLYAAASKIVDPLVPFEMLAHVTPPGPGTKALLALAVGAEVALGAAMLLRVVTGFALSLAGVVLLSLVLLVVRAAAGELVPCGCFGDFLGTTVDGALIRNAVIAAVLVALIVWEHRRDHS